jgi:ribosomal protein S13
MTEMPMGQGSAPESQGNPVAPPSNDGGQQQDSTGGINPAWNDLLGVVPSQLHSQVTPHLQKWDQNYQQSIDKVHSQYEPWKGIIDQGVNPEDVEFSLGLLNAISSNPQEVLNALQEWVAAENGEEFQPEQQGQFNQNPQSPEYDITQHPAYQELYGVVESMAQILMGQKEQEQQTLQDQELEQELTTLRETYGDFDEDYVLGVALNTGGDLEAAVKKDIERQQSILSGKRPPGPPVLGSGGASPNTNVDVTKLGSKDTRNLVANMLQQAAQQGN